MPINSIIDFIKQNGRAVIAVDGRCGAGKTTLANELARVVDCNVIHMDDFFLQGRQKTKERLEEPGGNIDYERFISEVLTPLNEGKTFSYRPYVCKTATFGEEIKITPKDVTVIEGSYSCHPKFWDFYDLHIFLDIPTEEQMKRIINRNGAVFAKKFEEIWIPMEEKYFKVFGIKEKCEIKG